MARHNGKEMLANIKNLVSETSTKRMDKLSHPTVYYGVYRKVSSISRTLAGYTIIDHSDVVGASPVGAAPTTSSFST